MVNVNSAIGKKRHATTKILSKPAKTFKKAEEEISDDLEKENEGLFDNLDEEMDPNELENIVNYLEESDSEEEDEEVEDNNEDQEDEEGEDEDEDGEDEDEDKAEGTDEDDKMENVETPVSIEQESTSKRFRDLYMTKVTQAFGSDLDQIRQEPNFNGPRLNILIDSLEAGIDIFSSLEQEIILADEEKSMN